MPDYNKDVAVAILGAAIALAGLLLAVAGFVLANVASFPVTVSNATKRWYEFAAKLAILPFLAALTEAALSLHWLLHATSCLYRLTVDGFFGLLVLTAIYGIVLLLRYL